MQADDVEQSKTGTHPIQSHAHTSKQPTHTQQRHPELHQHSRFAASAFFPLTLLLLPGSPIAGCPELKLPASAELLLLASGGMLLPASVKLLLLLLLLAGTDEGCTGLAGGRTPRDPKETGPEVLLLLDGLLVVVIGGAAGGC